MKRQAMDRLVVWKNDWCLTRVLVIQKAIDRLVA